MGWTFTSKGSQTTKEFFEKEFNYDKGDGRSGKIIRFSATWTTAYMAYEIKVPETKDENGNVLPAKRDVIAIVCLIRHVPRALDGYTFGYKDMTENMGPCESRCPKTILDLLTPTTSEYANDWRKRCWDRINKRKAAPKVKAGDLIKFKHPIPFCDGTSQDTLRWSKGNRFYGSGYSFYRISDWREREYQNLGQHSSTLAP